MQKLFLFKIHPLLPNPLPNAVNPSSFRPFPPSNPPPIRTPIIYANYNNRRPSSGPPKSTRSVLKLIQFVASNFNVLPEPWNSMVRQFGGGNMGGGTGKGFGWGGFDGWGWKRRRRGKKGKWGIFGVLIAFGLGLWLCLGKELELDLFVGGLCLSLVLVIANALNKKSSEWIFGFSCGAAVVGLGMRKQDLEKWFKGLQSMVAGRRSKRRRAM